MWPILIAAAALGIAGCASSTRQEDTEGVDDTDSLPDQDGDGYSDANDCAPADASLQVLISGYKDQDRDGYTSGDLIEECVSENGQSSPYYTAVKSNPEDCDDTDAEIYPGQSEILDNDVDENCDGLIETTPPVDRCEGLVGITFDTNPIIINLENQKDASQGLQITTGDFDGDGIQDLAFGVLGANSSFGNAYAFKGGAGTVFDTLGTIVSADIADFILNGGGPYEGTGGPIAAYDVDRDGKDELMTSTNGYVTGISHIFETGQIDTSTIDFSNQIIPAEYDMFFIGGGLKLQYLLNVGDINGNGLDSLMVTNASSQCVTLELDDITGFVDSADLIQHTFYRAYGDEGVCNPTSTVGADLNGDGINELIFGATSDMLNGNAGHGQIIRGGAIPKVYTLPKIGEDAEVEYISWTGTTEGGWSGSYLNVAYLDGDENPDLLIGGIRESNNYTNSGANHFIPGSNFVDMWTDSGLQSGDDITLAYGETLNPTSVANLSNFDGAKTLYGDVTNAMLTNGGGMVAFHDAECDVGVLVTSAATYSGKTDGRIYITSLSRIETSEENQIVVNGIDDQVLEGDAGSLLGYRIKLVDLTGDDLPELIATAPRYDNQRGQVRIYQGVEVRE